MYEPSFMSTNTIRTYAKKIAQHGHPVIDITFDHHHHHHGVSLDQHNDSAVTYTTGDSLSGQATITAPHHTRFDEVQITLEGITSTYVEMMTPVASQSRVKARHLFLKLTMPIPEADYPQPRIAEADRAYRFPFHFVIPPHLLLSACRHETVGRHVHEAHLHLPPSMGDATTSPRDDLSPDMVKVQYAVRVRVTRVREHDGKLIILTDHARQLRVVPAIPEAPPMHIAADDQDYALSVTKVLRKGVFGGRMGGITVSASQTKALTISPTAATPPTIMATLRLRFDPASPSAEPPRLGSLTSKIKAATFYAVKGHRDLAARHRLGQAYDATRGVYLTSIPLASRSMESVVWTHHGPPAAAAAAAAAAIRRDSGYSTSSDGSRADATQTPGRGWHEASILVPLTLPACKTWLPSFHSCLVSRIYTLEMTLSVQKPGTGMPSTTIALRLPVQISSGPEDGQAPSYPAAVAAEVDEYFRPRVISVPDEGFVQHSVLARHAPPAAAAALEADEGLIQNSVLARHAAAAALEAPPPGYQMHGRNLSVLRSH